MDADLSPDEEEPALDTSGVANGGALSRHSSASSTSSHSSTTSINVVTQEEFKKSCLASAVWSILPALILTVVGFAIILCVAFDTLHEAIQQWFFLGLYGLAILGMGTLLLLHSCRKLATGGKGRPDKKRGFTLGGIFILGSGGMIFQSLSLFSVAIIFDKCPNHRDLAVTAADLFVSGLQVLFLVKFLSVRINRSVLAVAFSRVVLMHMIATNMCLWFHTIITESLREIDELGQDEDIPHLHSHPPQTTSSSIETNETMTGKEEHAVFMALTSGEREHSSCGTASAVADVISPYAYPLLIEFSVLAVGLFLSIWEQTATKHVKLANKPTTIIDRSNDSIDTAESDNNKSNGSDSNSCDESDVETNLESIHYHNPGEGIFMGWIVVLGTIVFVILFTYDSYRHSIYSSSFGAAVYGAHATLSSLQLVTVIYTTVRMTSMKRHEKKETTQEKREKHLLTVCFLSVVIYKVFCLVTGFVHDELIIIVDGFLTIFASTAQTAFINWFASTKRLARAKQRRYKPGRQGLELLRCTNVGLWLVNTFLMKTTVAKKPLEETIGYMTWIITSNVVQPLTILFYFHSIMCIATIIAEVHSR